MDIKHARSIFEFQQEFKDSTKVILWKVIFTGVHGKLNADIYKNNLKICNYTCPLGHACKTKAITLIKNEISIVNP